MRQSFSTTEVDVAFIDEPLVVEAEEFVSGCEHCDDAALIPFDYVLDALTACDPSKTEPLMRRIAQCPRCLGEITEKTLVTVEPVGDPEPAR
jgi:hypothetical protein